MFSTVTLQMNEEPALVKPGESMNRRILLIDDNHAIHDDYMKILVKEATTSALDSLSADLFGESETSSSEFEFEVFSAFQGKEACDMVQKSLNDQLPFALAFVDMRMPPGWDGLQTMEHLWEVDPNLQIVICTAYSDQSWSEINDRVKYRERLLILKKPFDSVEVLQLAIALTLKWNLEQQAKQKMRAIVETTRDGILTFDKQGIIHSSNSAAFKLFDCEKNQFLGRELNVFLPDVAKDDWPQILNQSIQPKQANQSIELEGRSQEGRLIPLLISLSRFGVDDETMYAMILRDLSDYKRLQRELSQAQKLESIGQLAAGMVHEINTPMQFVQDNLQFLKDSCENLLEIVGTFDMNLSRKGEPISWDERVQLAEAAKTRFDFAVHRANLAPAIEESMDGVKRVIEIVRAMKDFSHISDGEKLPADLNQAVQNTAALTRNRLKKIAELQLELDPDLPLVKCHLAEVSQVLLNLVVNSADAIEEKLAGDQSKKGRVKILTRSEGDQVILEVQDSGAGVPEEYLDRIFEPFFTTKEVGKGTGQGLSLAQEVIVNRHLGEISVHSEVGVGSTFTISLPCE